MFDSVKSQHAKWVAESLRKIQKINFGMTREQLLKLFREEGGISSPKHRTYVYRQCDDIKVDVIFELQDKTAVHPTDTIVKISKPYLIWSVID